MGIGLGSHDVVGAWEEGPDSLARDFVMTLVMQKD